jgi:hypothetical protein
MQQNRCSALDPVNCLREGLHEPQKHNQTPTKHELQRPDKHAPQTATKRAVLTSALIDTRQKDTNTTQTKSKGLLTTTQLACTEPLRAIRQAAQDQAPTVCCYNQWPAAVSHLHP